jgi:hypothetical protein
VRKKVLFEDTTMQYNKWVSGQAAREFNSQRMKFKDLVSQYHDTDQSPNAAKADNALPYEVVNAANILSNLVADTVRTINAFKQAVESPVVAKDQKIKEEIAEIVIHLTHSLSYLKRILKADTVKDLEDLE